MSNDSQVPGRAGLFLVIFGLIAILIAWDLVADHAQGVDHLHVAIELALLILSATMFAHVLRQVLRSRRKLRVLNQRLDSAQAESQRWRASYQGTLQGLSTAIQAQFGSWQLSPAESEIALLLLKGLSLKEIAALRETGERTVREQARAVYRKAGLAGRSELSAFFLEDLLLPRADQSRSKDPSHPAD
ncbi:helix-turn-helix transcriptional regulator [Wenzhouxiangella marina]|uniref:Transcriptional regulator, LuxR family n=1 Tax=Wenzhouxiangella marina TaxID=1579979 RepID=A0A0K0XXV4_9GAMM|nr:LuxR C-terminal-related transcriptional regulator [Wenzhouxiangella marina]AKS42462.1 Transcriptional regulator, LuxR family [Wenzhouxiangella marina]MBB6085763.1 DNA-binding CsgD family transcriptional regulator [Wenzhouxiangella marina]